MLEESDLIRNLLFNFKNEHKMTHRAFVKQGVDVFSNLLNCGDTIAHLLWRRSLSLRFGYQSKFQGIGVKSIIQIYEFKALALL